MVLIIVFLGLASFLMLRLHLKVNRCASMHDYKVK